MKMPKWLKIPAKTVSSLSSVFFSFLFNPQITMSSKPLKVLHHLQCKYCQRSFADFQSLRLHTRNHRAKFQPYWYKKPSLPLPMSQLNHCNYSCNSVGRESSTLIPPENSNFPQHSLRLRPKNINFPQHVFGLPPDNVNFHQKSTAIPPENTSFPQSLKDPVLSEQMLCDLQGQMLFNLLQYGIRSPLMTVPQKTVANGYTMPQQLVTNGNPPQVKPPKPQRFYQCQHCSKTFSNTTDRRRHEVIHTGNKLHQCKYCQKGFNRLDNKKRHEMGHETSKEDRQHKCNFCATYNKDVQESDMEKTSVYQCKYCNKEFSRPCFRHKHEQAHAGDERYQCQLCSRSFLFASHLKQHGKVHSTERPYSCPICSKTFKQAAHAKRHERMHSQERKHICSFCGKGFMSAADRARHEARHTGERSYMCQYCGKLFIGPGDLITHERIHTGNHPYHCKHCNKGFMKASRKENHERAHERKGNFSGAINKSHDENHKQGNTEENHKHAHDEKSNFPSTVDKDCEIDAAAVSKNVSVAVWFRSSKKSCI